MPTGYTERLYDGEQTFEEYVWRCARMMGPLFSIRDARLDSPIPDVLECDVSYEQERLSEISARLEAACSWTPVEAAHEAQLAYERLHASWAAHCTAVEARKQRYLKMLRQVVDWKPPTPEHEGLKVAMVQQLRSSITADCHAGPAPTMVPSQEYRDTVIKRALSDIEYYSENIQKAKNRTAESNEWLDALREAVPVPRRENESSAEEQQALVGELGP